MINFSQDPKTLCIFRLSSIGDVSHILPIIHTLKKVWPKTRITWIIGKLEYQLVKSLADVGSLYLINRRVGEHFVICADS